MIKQQSIIYRRKSTYPTIQASMVYKETKVSSFYFFFSKKFQNKLRLAERVSRISLKTLTRKNLWHSMIHRTCNFKSSYVILIVIFTFSSVHVMFVFKYCRLFLEIKLEFTCGSQNAINVVDCKWEILCSYQLTPSPSKNCLDND